MGGPNFFGKCLVRAGASRIPGNNGETMTMNRNILFLLIGALLVGVGVLGYALYQEKKQPSGVQINLGPGGVKIEKK